MKKLIISLACVMMLTSCGNTDSSSSSKKASSSEPAVEETTAAEETTAEEVTTTAAAETETTEATEAATSAPEHDFSKYSFKMKDDGVDVLLEDEVIQTLKVDCAEVIGQCSDIGVVPEDVISFEDFDFDGCPDIFVAQMIGRPNIPGKYFHYDAGSDEFVPWDALDELDILVRREETSKTLVLSKSFSAAEHEVEIYHWDHGSLEIEKRMAQYCKDDAVYLDTYEYENGQEKLVSTVKMGEENEEG